MVSMEQVKHMKVSKLKFTRNHHVINRLLKYMSGGLKQKKGLKTTYVSDSYETVKMGYKVDHLTQLKSKWYIISFVD